MLERDDFPSSLVPDYLSEAMVSYPARGGKRLRPALLVWSCEAAGGVAELAWDAALAVELYHNWTLIHDDIIDDDAVRRGQPTCHVALSGHAAGFPSGHARRKQAFGGNMAILAGDVLHAWSVECLARSADRGAPADVVLALVRRMCQWLTPMLISGEAMDVEFELRHQVPAGEIRDMMFRKTGALLQFCAEAGVVLATGSDFAEPEVVAAGQFAALAGLAFQAQDDLLGVFAEDAAFGKPVGSDLAEGKHTLLLARTLAMAGERQRAELLACLGPGDEMTEQQLRLCRRIISDCGAREAVAAEAEQASVRARDLLHGCFPPSAARDRLGEWLEFLTKRSF
jgi:geranylgeranyl diphosphate synthase type I